MQWVRSGRFCVLDVVEEYVLGLGRARGCEEVKGGHVGRYLECWTRGVRV